MSEHVRVELVVSDPPDCPVAEAGEDAMGRSVGRTGTRNDGTVTEEAVFDDPDAVDAEPVYENDSEAVFRFERRGDCLCDLVESHGHPVVDARVRDGDLYVVFHVRDRERVGDVVSDLRESYSSVGVRRVTARGSDGALLHTETLTDRQREAIETAHEMGYFEHPKDSNATEVADAMGIATSTFTEHLSAAQTKILDDML